DGFKNGNNAQELALGSLLLELSLKAKDFVPTAGAILGGLNALTSFSKLLSGGSFGGSSTAFQLDATIKGHFTGNYMLIPLSTSIPKIGAQIPYYAAKVDPDGKHPEDRALGLFSFRTPPKVKVHYGIAFNNNANEPPPNAISQMWVTVGDPLCQLSVNHATHADLLETKVAPYLDGDLGETKLQTAPTPPIEMPLFKLPFPAFGVNESAYWIDRLRVRVYLKFRLSNGEIAEYIRTLKPEVAGVGTAAWRCDEIGLNCLNIAP